MSGCIFCEIVEGSAPCVKIYEDDSSLAFMDIFPVSAGHTLIIPKAHASNLFEIAPESLAAVSRASRILAVAMGEALAPDGVMVMQLNGAAAGQTVFHYHTHLIPRAEGSSLALEPRVPGKPEELSTLAQQIRAALP